MREGKSPGEGYINSIGMTFRWCPPGSYAMGSDKTGTPATRDRAPVQVTLSQGFWMGEYEVTQREYYAVRRKNPPRGFSEGGHFPYWGASEYKSVTEFCKALNEKERKAGVLPDGWEYELPLRRWTRRRWRW